MAEKDDVSILAVDDLPEKLLVLESILAELGVNLVTARSGEEALRLVLGQDFAVILLDVNMPGMDGLETAAYIRRRKKSAHTPIIFITAYADEAHTAQGYSLGAVDYIFAPVVPEILRTKVKVFVDLFRMSQQVRRQADERVALAQEQALRAAAEEATRHSAFLVDATTKLSSSLDYDLAQQTLARLAVPLLADWSAVTRIDEAGGLGPSALAWTGRSDHVEMGTAAKAAELTAGLAPLLEQALATGKKQAANNLGRWTPPGGDRSADNGAPVPEELPLGAVLVLPLCARGRTLGLLALARRAREPKADAVEAPLAEDLAARAAIALDNAQLYQDVQRADRHKNEFLAMLAHELRNPLAPIRNAVDILQLSRAEHPPLDKARQIIDRQVTHLSRLVDDLLDVSRLSRGKILLRREQVDLTKLVREVVADHEPDLEAAGLKVRIEAPAMSVWTFGDHTRLAQVIGNVLHNAEKFTDPGGDIVVRLTPDQSAAAVVLSVRDNGIGMDRETLASLFSAFSQADRSLDRSRGGLGLGLALVKGLIELHGGDVEANSGGSGQGTEVIVRLPLADKPAPRREERPTPANDASSLRIVVVEDNADTAESMRMLLSHVGHHVRLAATGDAALEAVRDFRPEVVLCDVGLPGAMDGYAVARALRREPELAATVLIAITGYGRPEDQQLARDAGFDHHLTKPVRLQELQQLLASIPRESDALLCPGL